MGQGEYVQASLLTLSLFYFIGIKTSRYLSDDILLLKKNILVDLSYQNVFLD